MFLWEGMAPLVSHDPSEADEVPHVSQLAETEDEQRPKRRRSRGWDVPPPSMLDLQKQHHVAELSASLQACDEHRDQHHQPVQSQEFLQPAFPQGLAAPGNQDVVVTLLQQLQEGRLSQEAFEERAASTIEMPHTITAKYIAAICFLYGKRRIRPGQALMQVLEARALDCLEPLAGTDPHELAELVRGYAMVGWRPGQDVIERIDDRACALAGEFETSQIVIFLVAYTTLGIHTSHELKTRLHMQATARAGDFLPQEAERILLVYSSLNWKENRVGALNPTPHRDTPNPQPLNT